MADRAHLRLAQPQATARQGRREAGRDQHRHGRYCHQPVPGHSGSQPTEINYEIFGQVFGSHAWFVLASKKELTISNCFYIAYFEILRRSHEKIKFF
jgi:hypothetical protein